MKYWKYNILNLRYLFIFYIVPIAFMVYWLVTGKYNAPYGVVIIAMAVLFVGISVGNYIVWRKVK